MVGDISIQHRTDKNGVTRIFYIIECRSVDPGDFNDGTGSALLDTLWWQRKNVNNNTGWFDQNLDYLLPGNWLSEMQPNKPVPFYTKHAGHWFDRYDNRHVGWPTDDLGDEVDYVIPKIVSI